MQKEIDKMVKYKIEKEGKSYYARVYSNKGILLDSLVFGNRIKAKKSLDRIKKIRMFE